MIAKTFKRLTSPPDKSIRKDEPQRHLKVVRREDKHSCQWTQQGRAAPLPSARAPQRAGEGNEVKLAKRCAREDAGAPLGLPFFLTYLIGLYAN